MKKSFPLLMAGLLFSTSTMLADVELTDVGSENMTDIIPQEGDRQRPFWFEANFDYIGKSRFDDDRFKGEHIRYAQAEMELGAVYYYNKWCDEGLTAAVSFTACDLHWENNPFFEKNNFHTASLTLNGFTHRFCNWRWIAQIAMNVDTDYSHFNHYTTYDMLLWGRYAFCNNIGFHVGFIALTGLQVDRVYPILGFDWEFCNDWKLSLVFPLNVSLTYTFCPNWVAGVGGRYFYTRHRVGKYEPLSEGIWEYRNVGVEALINYEEDDWFKANIHGGYAFGGSVKISNRHHKHGHRLEFGGAPYVGAGFEYRF